LERIMWATGVASRRRGVAFHRTFVLAKTASERASSMNTFWASTRLAPISSNSLGRQSSKRSSVMCRAISSSSDWSQRYRCARSAGPALVHRWMNSRADSRSTTFGSGGSRTLSVSPVSEPDQSSSRPSTFAIHRPSRIISRLRAHFRRTWDGCHHSETEKATIADDQWPCDWCIEDDLHMPKSLLRESRPSGKCFHAFAIGLEWLSLHADRFSACAYLCVAKGLNNCSCRAFLFGGSLRTALGLRSNSPRID